ncbi:SPOR domain-containing protein [Spongorhabdus nitratireducens]
MPLHKKNCAGWRASVSLLALPLLFVSTAGSAEITAASDTARAYCLSGGGNSGYNCNGNPDKEPEGGWMAPLELEDMMADFSEPMLSLNALTPEELAASVEITDDAAEYSEGISAELSEVLAASDRKSSPAPDFTPVPVFTPATASVAAPAPKVAPAAEPASDLGIKTKGYTIQLAAFRTKERLKRFLETVEDRGNLYRVKRSDGWMSVGYGFYSMPGVANADLARLKAAGVQGWLRPVEFAALEDVNAKPKAEARVVAEAAPEAKEIEPKPEEEINLSAVALYDQVVMSSPNAKKPIADTVIIEDDSMATMTHASNQQDEALAVVPAAEKVDVQTAVVKAQNEPEVKPEVASDVIVAQTSDGYTLQLAAFRTQERMDKFLDSVDDIKGLYMISRNDGWLSVGYGYFAEVAQANEANQKLKQAGLQSWVRPVSHDALEMLSDADNPVVSTLDMPL